LIDTMLINASIEATRAGDLGKGFSLIASEVRDLSNRSRIDLEEINQEIEKLETSLRNLVTAIDAISDSALKTSETSDYFKQRTLDLAGETKGLSGRIYSASSAVASQLPAVSALIDDIKQIKANTEAAVVGSQTNIELCDQTLTNLKLAQNDNQSGHLIAS
ncbi:MAG: methyl-accepting chemotaxis protein, partial [Pseudomonadota bacterium]